MYRLSTISAYNNNGVEVYGNWLLDTTAALPLFGPHQLEVEDLLLGDPVVLGVDHGKPLVHGPGVGGHVVGHLGRAQLDSLGGLYTPRCTVYTPRTSGERSPHLKGSLAVIVCLAYFLPTGTGNVKLEQ